MDEVNQHVSYSEIIADCGHKQGLRAKWRRLVFQIFVVLGTGHAQNTSGVRSLSLMHP